MYKNLKVIKRKGVTSIELDRLNLTKYSRLIILKLKCILPAKNFQ